MKEIPTVEKIRNKLSIRQTATKKSIFEALDEFVETESKIQFWTKGTANRFYVMKNHLLTFSKKKKYKFDFDDLNEGFFNRFFDYLIYDCKHSNPYTNKNLKILKWFLNWARKRKYLTNLYYLDYRLPKKTAQQDYKANIIFLDWTELMKLYNLKIKPVYLEQIRDVFCFQCFTGLRYSDVYNLKKSNIQNGIIILDTVKTSDQLGLPLNDFSKEIVNKYRNFPGTKLLPVISNQKMNDYLKVLGKLAELNNEVTKVFYSGSERTENIYKKWEVLTTHVGRKTFITICIQLGIPMQVIQTFTGHKDYKTIERYFKIVAPQKTAEMAKFSKSYLKIAK